MRRNDLPACRFVDRCERATPQCRTSLPMLDAAAEHAVACWHPLDQAQLETVHA
jgi:ABC-type dipeptide/oligopeptide/nickel transport system ATPase component